MIQGHNNPVHIIVVSYDCGGSKYTHDATKDGIVLGIKVIIKVLLIVVSLSLLNLQLEKIYKKKIKCTDRKAFNFVMGCSFQWFWIALLNIGGIRSSKIWLGSLNEYDEGTWEQGDFDENQCAEM